jgi:hypothetical protein
MFLGLALALAATSALAADNLDLARRLGRYDGGVTLLLKNFESGLAASTAAPDIFRQSYDQAIIDNQPVIAAADEQIARVYVGLFSTAQLSAEVGFYESPEGQSIISRNRTPTGAVRRRKPRRWSNSIRPSSNAPPSPPRIPRRWTRFWRRNRAP